MPVQHRCSLLIYTRLLVALVELVDAVRLARFLFAPSMRVPACRSGCTAVLLPRAAACRDTSLHVITLEVPKSYRRACTCGMHASAVADVMCRG